jgi:hypothetical protein
VAFANDNVLYVHAGVGKRDGFEATFEMGRSRRAETDRRASGHPFEFQRERRQAVGEFHRVYAACDLDNVRGYGVYSVGSIRWGARYIGPV